MLPAPPSMLPAPSSIIDRRRFLRGLGVLGAGAAGSGLYLQSHAAAVTAVAPRPLPDSSKPGLWSDPRSWATGKVPGRNDIAVVDRPIILQGAAEVAGVRVEATGALVFAPGVSSTLTSRGNIVVSGALVLRPLHGLVQHTITFLGIDESRVVGGGMKVLDSDVGLWILDAGVLDAVGTPKQAWTTLVGDAAKGARTLAPRSTAGWLPGDRIVVTPTMRPDPDPKSTTHATAYDDAILTSVSPASVGLNKALSFPHPAVADSFGNRWTAEALNLTRNVVIEGTATGRAHIMFMHGSRPQRISDVELRHLGPREHYVNDNGKRRTRGVLGRYPLHFHMAGWATEGSIIRNVVVHSSGNRAFVPHESHGMTFDGCIAHDTFADPYWWDVAERGQEQQSTHKLLYRNCVASLVKAEQNTPEAYRLSAFHLGKGEERSNRAEGCVAVGVVDGHQSSGFAWPERSRGVWDFTGCIAHNNVNHGVLSWQNTEDVSVIGNFAAYHNGGSGVLHGAYSNFWLYHDCDLYANRYSGLEIHAVTRRTGATKRYYKEPYPLLTFRKFRIDGGGLSRFGIATEGHRFPAEQDVPVLVAECDVRAVREAAFRMGPWNNREEYEIVNCRFDGRHFLLDPGMNPTSFSRVRNLNGDGKTQTVWLAGTKAGTARPDWNATVVSG